MQYYLVFLDLIFPLLPKRWIQVSFHIGKKNEAHHLNFYAVKIEAL